MNKRGFIDDLDEEWLIAGGMGILCAFVMLAMFHFGNVPISVGTKVIGMIAGFIAGTVVSRFIFNT